MTERGKYIVYWDESDQQKKVVYSFDRGGHHYLLDFYEIEPETISSFGVVQCDISKKAIEIVENAVWENPGQSKNWRSVFAEDNPLVLSAFQEYLAAKNKTQAAFYQQVKRQKER